MSGPMLPGQWPAYPPANGAYWHAAPTGFGNQPPQAQYYQAPPALPVQSAPTNWGENPSQREFQPADLQKQYPGLYARKASSLPMAETLPKAARAAATINQARKYEPARDYDLANLDDNMKRFGSLMIATMATLGLKQRIFGVGEFLGFASWFVAMAVTPKIVNAMVWAKTGVNLNQLYDSTYGSRQNVYKDPHYLPLHILSDQEINKVADRLKIPKDAPNRRQLTEDRMRQISVQAHTWWMLIAGLATPVISGLICDQFQDPATRMVNAVKTGLARSAVGKSTTPEALAKRTQAVLDQIIGEVPESSLSSWWKDFGRGMARHTGLKKSLAIKEVVDSQREPLVDKLVEHFSKLDPKSATVSESVEYLARQREEVVRLQKQAAEFLAGQEGKLPAEALKRQQRFVETRITNALSTLNHYDRLFKSIQAGSADPKTIRQLLQKPVLAEVQKLIDTGFIDEAKKLAGSPETFKEIQKSLGIRQYGRAFKLMGASPEAHLLTALKDNMLRKLWQRRVLGVLGGGMLAATFLYNLFVIGRNTNKGAR